MNTLSARNGGFILCLLIILAYGVSISLYMLEHLDLFSVISMYADDAYYYFQIARNFADGKFSTFDGGITRTNGYHPLWMFLITPLWWLFDSESVLFAIQVYQIMLAAIAVMLIVIAARLANVYWLLLFGVLPVLYHTSGSFSGLEVSAGLFILGMLFLALGLFVRDPVRWRWFLAIIAFLLPWARLEYMAISLSVTAILCFIEYSRAHNHKMGDRGFGYSLTPLLGAGASCLVYFAYNRIVFSGYVPVSGATKQFFSQARFDGKYSFLQNFQDIANTEFFDHELLVAFEVCIYFILIWRFCLRNQKREDWLFLSFLIGMFGLAMGHIVKFGQSVIMMHPDVVNAAAWHFVPGFLMMALIIPVRCYIVVYFINYFVDGKYPRIAGVLRKSVLVFAAWFIFMNINFLAPYQHVEHYVKPQRPTWVESNYASSILMNRILPEGSIIGSWDSGAIAYFSKFPVVNLDGLVNSYDFLRMRRDNSNWNWDRYSDSNLELYRRLFGITHFSNLVSSFAFSGSRKLLQNKLLETYAAIDNSRVFVLWSFSTTEKFTNRNFDFMIAEVGVVIHERFVQIFSDCEIAKDGSLLVVLFDGEDNVLGIANPWENRWTMKRGKAPGSCIDTIRLSRNAAAPVRIEILSYDEAISRLIENRRMIISSDYATGSIQVYLHKHNLVYVNDQCDPDMSPSFFMEFTPLDDFDLLIGDRRKGFNSYVFDFDDYARRIGNDCIAILPLPEYGIAKIRTGQFTDKALLWDADFRFDMITHKAG